MMAMTTADPSFGVDQGLPTSFTVLVCHGCCCATVNKHPDVDHLGHLRQIEAAVSAADVARARVRVTDCLGPCSRSNVVVIRPRTAGQRHLGLNAPPERRAVWLGHLLDDRAIGSLTGWLRVGGPVHARLPTALADHRFDPTNEQAQRSARSDQHRAGPDQPVALARTITTRDRSSAPRTERSGGPTRRRRHHR